MAELRVPHANRPPSLIAIVLELTPLSDSALPAFVGYHNLSATLALLQEHDRALSKQEHDREVAKALTCSGLLGDLRYDRKGQATVEQGRRYWVRITGLTEQVCAALQQVLVSKPPTEWVLRSGSDSATRRSVMFQVVQVIHDKLPHHPRSDLTYEELWKGSEQITSSKISLELVSPTAFTSKQRTADGSGKSHELSITLPQPGHFFNSLGSRWNALSPPEYHLQLGPWSKIRVEASRFELTTSLIKLFEGAKSRSSERVQKVGAIGSITYTVLDPRPDMARWLNLLADFGFYSGVGTKTSMGMGQVRRAT